MAETCHPSNCGLWHEMTNAYYKYVKIAEKTDDYCVDRGNSLWPRGLPPWQAANALHRVRTDGGQAGLDHVRVMAAPLTVCAAAARRSCPPPWRVAEGFPSLVKISLNIVSSLRLRGASPVNAGGMLSTCPWNGRVCL